MLCDVEKTGANSNCKIGKKQKQKQKQRQKQKQKKMEKCVVCSPAAADCEAERERLP